MIHFNVSFSNYFIWYETEGGITAEVLDFFK